MASYRHRCTRGVFGLKTWDTPRRPACLIEANKENATTGLSSSKPSTPSRSTSSVSQDSSPSKTIPKASPGQKLLAKYTYKAKPDSPLGGNELNVKQGDKLVFQHEHPDTGHWWWVQTEEGSKTGFVPSTYMFPIEEKVTSLPWLQNRPVEKLPPVDTGSYKPYVSAYDKSKTNSENSSEASQSENYRCDLCCKTLNGPIPYSMHLKSKAHKEEMEIAELL